MIARKKGTIIQGVNAKTRDQARARLIVIVMALIMGYFATALRLADLTLLRGQEEEASRLENGDAARPLTRPLRGMIVDRNGMLLATSLKMASVYVDAVMIEDPKKLAKQLVEILPGQKLPELTQKLESKKRFVWIQRNITPKQEYAINSLGDPALSFEEEDRRFYPNGQLAGHITGYTDVDGKGIAGIEKSFDKTLSEGVQPVRLTIDLRVQHILHRELAKAVKTFSAKAGIGLVMDAQNGEVIAMVSLPDFDPNRATEATDAEKFNRATLGVFEMGSTFKLFSTAAALGSGQVRISDTFDATDPIRIGRFTISDFHAKRRPLSVPEIFIYSSNIGTAKMAATIGNEKIRSFYRALGFMDRAQIELPERGVPLYPSPWRDVSTLTTSFGHGIAVSPLHLVRAAAGLVNGGFLPQSTIVLQDEQAIEKSLSRVTSEESSRQIRQLLELVVTSGTGNNAAVAGYNVGGKTGTAEKNSGGRYEKDLLLSSFLGVYPAHAPRYIVLAMLDEPKGTKETYGYATGGWTAAPVVACVIEQMGPLYNIRPDALYDSKTALKQLGGYLREYKEGTSLASAGTDH